MSTHKEDVQAMIDTLNAALADAEKFDKGNSAAGTRVRKYAQEVAVGCKALRKKVSDTKAERK
jgi:hypothetical protein